MELTRLLETLPPESRTEEISKESRVKQLMKRKSLVQFKQPEASHANESFVPDEEISDNRSQIKEQASSSSDRGGKS